MNHKLTVEEMQRIDIDTFRQAPKTPLVVVLDNIRSLHNVGSIFRTADAFRLQSLHLCGITGCPPQQDIHKTALGAEDAVEWHYHKDTADAIRLLKAQGYTIYAIEQVAQSIPLQQFSCAPNSKIAIIMGNEVMGVQQSIVDAADACIEIPQFGTKHSLNVSVSSGMVIWKIVEQLMF